MSHGQTLDLAVVICNGAWDPDSQTEHAVIIVKNFPVSIKMKTLILILLLILIGYELVVGDPVHSDPNSSTEELCLLSLRCVLCLRCNLDFYDCKGKMQEFTLIQLPNNRSLEQRTVIQIR